MRAARRRLVMIAPLLAAAACFPSFAGLTSDQEDPTVHDRDGGRADGAGGSLESSTGEGDGAGDGDGDPGAPPEHVTLAVGASHACARLPNATVRCWGDNGAGQLGLGVPFDSVTFKPRALTPLPVPGIDDAIAIGGGLSHTCVIHRDATVSCWGYNYFGQLGAGGNQRSEKPIRVAGLTDVTFITGGVSFTCAIKKDRTVVCWGSDDSGQLGDQMTQARPTPAPVKNLANVVDLALGFAHACAALTDGTVMCWGGNAFGQLGIGSIAPQELPMKVDGLADVVQIVTAETFACARQRGGGVQCWGNNDRGELGTGSATASPVLRPKPLPSLTDAIWVWAGDVHACAVRKGGAVVCWGVAENGQVGTGAVVADGTAFATPMPVAGVPGPARAVWTNGRRSCAVTEDDHAYCWGENDDGELGNGGVEVAYGAVPVKDLP